MEKRLNERLIQELREQVNDLMAAAQLLVPLVREQGSERDEENLAALERNLYCVLRTVDHMELCREEPPMFSPRAVDLSGLCREIGRQVGSVAPQMGIAFTWELGKEGIMAQVDRSLLETAILNLVSNAARAAGQGGEVSLHCKVVEGQCHILVRDNGPGLRREDPEADPLLKRDEGLGLGLEVVRRIAKLHGGTLLMGDGSKDGVGVGLAIPLYDPKQGEGPKGLKEPDLPVDRLGGFSPLLVELAPQLPDAAFGYKLLD